MKMILLEYYCDIAKCRVIWPETLSGEEAVERGRTLKKAVVLKKEVDSSSFGIEHPSSSFERLPL